MNYLLSFFNRGNKRKHEASEAQQDEATARKKLKLEDESSANGGYRFQFERLPFEEVKEGQGLLVRGIRDGGRKAIRLEALAFQTPRQQYQSVRLDLVTETTEMNVEVDREDLLTLLDLTRAALSEDVIAQQVAHKRHRVLLNSVDGVYKATRAGNSGSWGFMLKATSSNANLFDFIITHVAPSKFSLQSHAKNLDKQDVKALLKCIEDLLAGMKRNSFPVEKEVVPRRPAVTKAEKKREPPRATTQRKKTTVVAKNPWRDEFEYNADSTSQDDEDYSDDDDDCENDYDDGSDEDDDDEGEGSDNDDDDDDDDEESDEDDAEDDDAESEAESDDDEEDSSSNEDDEVKGGKSPLKKKVRTQEQRQEDTAKERKDNCTTIGKKEQPEKCVIDLDTWEPEKANKAASPATKATDTTPATNAETA